MENRHIILPGHLVDLRAQSSDIGDDDIVIGQPQVCQFIADHMTVRAPIDMVQRDRHTNGYRSAFNVDGDFLTSAFGIESALSILFIIEHSL